MAAQQQAYNADLARLRAEMENLRREKESAQTDNIFNNHEAREAGMARRNRANHCHKAKVWHWHDTQSGVQTKGLSGRWF